MLAIGLTWESLTITVRKSCNQETFNDNIVILIMNTTIFEAIFLAEHPNIAGYRNDYQDVFPPLHFVCDSGLNEMAILPSFQ